MTRSGRPRKNPPRGTDAYRELQRQRQADHVERKRRAKKCARCPRRAAINPKTGRPMWKCRQHLDEDNRYKKDRQEQKGKL
jgi:hypothetical protein